MIIYVQLSRSSGRGQGINKLPALAKAFKAEREEYKKLFRNASF